MSDAVIHPVRRTVSRAAWAASLTVAMLILGSAPAAADLRLLEVVGAVPLDDETRQAGIPKDRAIDEALWEGVSRVADDLLVDSIVPEPEGGGDPIRAALGRDMVPYTRSFRIVDDQGERPALFTEHPDAATEYVVVVEVQVEAERVRERLVAAGLLEDEQRSATTGIELEVRDLSQYGGYAELATLLVSAPVGAASASPLELERGRAVLLVEAEWGVEELLERLLAAAPAGMRITPIEVQNGRESGAGWAFSDAEPSRLVISVRWTPPSAPENRRQAPG